MNPNLTSKEKRELAQLAERVARFFKTHKWCQGHYAIGKSGGDVNVRSRYAVAWCGVGAMDKLGGRYHMTRLDFYIRAEILKQSFVGWQDCSSRKKSDIIQLFEKVAKQLRGTL
jgi:hypothetical protein